MLHLEWIVEISRWDSEYLAAEGKVTQRLEMGMTEAAPDFDQAIQDIYLYR